MSRQVNTILSPSLFSQIEDIESKIVVVIDVLRATSTIATILANGANSVQAVANETEAKAFQAKGYLVGGERGGKTIEGFDFGNSPFHYQTEQVLNKDVILTTTNGTKCIEMASKAKHLIIGSFLNLERVCYFLDEQEEDIVLFCAGWKDKVNMEDSLFAGAICHELLEDYKFDDASLIAQSAYSLAQHDLYRHLQQSSHFARLSKHGVDKDIEYCCLIDELGVLPILKDGKLIIHEEVSV